MPTTYFRPFTLVASFLPSLFPTSGYFYISSSIYEISIHSNKTRNVGVGKKNFARSTCSREEVALFSYEALVTLSYVRACVDQGALTCRAFGEIAA